MKHNPQVEFSAREDTGDFSSETITEPVVFTKSPKGGKWGVLPVQNIRENTISLLFFF